MSQGRREPPAHGGVRVLVSILGPAALRRPLLPLGLIRVSALPMFSAEAIWECSGCGVAGLALSFDARAADIGRLLGLPDRRKDL